MKNNLPFPSPDFSLGKYTYYIVFFWIFIDVVLLNHVPVHISLLSGFIYGFSAGGIAAFGIILTNFIVRMLILIAGISASNK